MTKYKFTQIWKRLPFLHYIELPASWYIQFNDIETELRNAFPKIDVEWDNAKIDAEWNNGSSSYASGTPYMASTAAHYTPSDILNSPYAFKAYQGQAKIKKKGRIKPFTVEEREKLQGNRKM